MYDFTGIDDFNNEKLNRVAADCLELAEQGRVWNRKLAEELDHEDYGYSEDVFANVVLKEVRDSLAEQDVIEVVEEKPAKGGVKRKTWRPK